MSREPFSGGVTSGDLSSPEAMRGLLSPLLLFDKCESAAFVRSAIRHARKKDLTQVSRYTDLLPTTDHLKLCVGIGRSGTELTPLKDEDLPNTAAYAARNLSAARTWFEHAAVAPETVQSTMYYYGTLSFFKFITSCLMKSRSSRAAHGLSVSCGSDGSDFHKDWPRHDCNVAVKRSGDFPFLVDALTAAGWPSLFSSFRLHQETKDAPYSAKKNPAPLATEKTSLSLLCQFSFDQYVSGNPGLVSWLEGANRQWVERMTILLVDYMIVFVASSLGRYYSPAWTAIVRAEKSSIYNDIRMSYRSVSMDAPLFFSREYPFKYSFV